MINAHNIRVGDVSNVFLDTIAGNFKKYCYAQLISLDHRMERDIICLPRSSTGVAFPNKPATPGDEGPSQSVPPVRSPAKEAAGKQGVGDSSTGAPASCDCTTLPLQPANRSKCPCLQSDNSLMHKIIETN